jgi:hypothetical protein
VDGLLVPGRGMTVGSGSVASSQSARSQRTVALRLRPCVSSSIVVGLSQENLPNQYAE